MEQTIQITLLKSDIKTIKRKDIKDKDYDKWLQDIGDIVINSRNKGKIIWKK